jgi:hypothetical protein
MIMTESTEQKFREMTSKSLEKMLRRFSELQVPEALKARLFAAIPRRRVRSGQEYHARRWRVVWGFGTAAAVVLFLAIMLAPNYIPSGPAKTVVADLNDRTMRSVISDQNSGLIKDTNNADCNVPQ